MKSYQGSVVVEADKSRVWAYLTDPHAIGAAMPDVVEYSVDTDQHITAKVRVGVGPVRAVMTLGADIEVGAEPDTARLVVLGNGMGNGVQLESAIALIADADSTRIDWTAEVAVSGALAALGARLMDSQVQKTTSQVFENIRRGVLNGGRDMEDA